MVSREESAMRPSVAFHDDLAPVWEDKYSRRSFSDRADVLLSFLDEHDLSGRRWLDAGCGSGRLTRMLAARGCEVIGVDASPAMVRVAADLGRTTVGGQSQTEFRLVDTIEELDWPDASLDGVLCSSVMEYLDAPEQSLLEFARVLRPGGLLLVSVPNRASLVRRVQKVCYRLTCGSWPRYLRYSTHECRREELASRLRACGFSILAMTYHGPCLPRWLATNRFAGALLMALASKQSGFPRDARQAAPPCS